MLLLRMVAPKARFKPVKVKKASFINYERQEAEKEKPKLPSKASRKNMKRKNKVQPVV